MEPDEEEERYEKFAYMGQKFRNMMHQYPQLEEYEEGIMDEVSSFIHMVSTHDYAESQVEAAVERYQELKGEGQRAEAAQMLIAAATTESTFAQFMLARELFKGEVLQQNYPESFTQINRLAEEDYAEAICDLGQLYEYGIGIDKNKRHALLLYEEAAEMGVDRAQSHYDRLKSSNPIQSIKSLTSSLLRKKK
jgi:TPR repeat protein